MDHRETLCQTILRSRQPKMSTFPTCQLSVILSVSEESDKPLLPTENKSIISFAQILHSVQDVRTVSFYQILHYACGFVQDDSERGFVQDVSKLDSVHYNRKKRICSGCQEEALYDRLLQCQRSTNTVFLYYIQNQYIIGKACSWTSLQNTDYEHEAFVSHCIPASS